jgi:cleavage and polyadenylation specificity factor subunit 4
MEEYVAPVREDVEFDFELFVKEQLGLYFGDEGRNRPICQFFLRGMCSRGTLCPSKHSKGNNVVVCKHWMRGLCKKGDLCEFLHEYRVSISYSNHNNNNNNNIHLFLKFKVG